VCVGSGKDRASYQWPTGPAMTPPTRDSVPARGWSVVRLTT
jgi:hypothetical protein